ncbi:TonB-dependent receptor plug domain-containing protein [Thalassotalea euphylliae]|uniref:TonB-dependent receptor n=1 Tax=Thalassotalea euphylliae TaxID=1655234 RepID=A0A3E0U509_9GAMM|nr:TonB-dependent receptor [Thalassotalea euphylliae]REL31794.1 TonB-dependent receptor [Thalassotalea euphylliae]
MTYFKPSVIAMAIATAASAGSVATSVAFAETVNEQEIEKISIIGSRRLGRSIEDSPVPIDILDADTLAGTGLTETNQLLNTLLPSFNFPQPSLTDGTDHVRPAQLRGLAPDHTLVLINGKRRHTSALLNLGGSAGRGSSAVDLNAIPVNAIERIEVLRDGAAAQYGSDAIAGVINIVLKNASSGGEVSVTYGGNVTEMEGVPNLEGVSVGEDGNLAFETGGDRDVTDGQTLTLRANSGFALGEDGFVNVSLEYRDRNTANRADFDPRENYERQADGSLDPRELTINRYNHTFGNGEVEDIAVFVNAGYYLDEDTELYAFGSYSGREGESGGFYRRAKDSRNVKAIYPDGFAPRITSKINDYSLAAGVKGYVLEEWNYDVSAVYGRDQFQFGVENSLNTSLGAQSPTDFDAGSLIYDQLTLNADFSRVFDSALFENGLNVAFGVEYRHESYEIEAGEPASYQRGEFGRGGAVRTSDSDAFGAAGSQVFVGFSPVSAGDNSRHNVSAYIDLETDITDFWNMTVAARYEDYSDFGSTLNGKIANRFSLTEELALRLSASTGFRAPSLQQQFFTNIQTTFVDSVPVETGTFAPGSDVAKALGSPGLDAEESVSIAGGITWTPVAELSLSIDAYRIDIDDRIVLSNNLSGPGIESLLAGTGATRARFFLNAIDSRTEGVDVVATYSLDLNTYGNVLFNAGYNYNDNEVTNIIEPPAALQGAGVDQGNLFSGTEILRFEVGSPKSKLNLSATWNFDDVKATLRTTRYGETQDPSINPARNEVIPTEWVTDIDVAYQLTDGLSLSVGANNVFDQYPDASRNLIDDVTTFTRIFAYSPFAPYGFTGRFVYGKVSYSF